MRESSEARTGLIDTDGLREAQRAAHSLVLFGNVLADDMGRGMLSLLDALSSRSALSQPRVASAYAHLFALLADEAELYPEELVGDAWQNHLLDRLLADENAFSRKAQLGPPAAMGPALRAAARFDLRRLHTLYRLSASVMARAANAMATVGNGDLGDGEGISWDGLAPLGEGPARHSSEGRRLKEAFAAADDWGSLVDEMASHYVRDGAGVFGRFRAFRWVPQEQGGYLEGIATPDPVRLFELIGYEAERRLLLRNTQQFLAGYPANNVLLYGDRGTGKSSTVKALLNEYADRGLRLIEVARQHLSDLPHILHLLRERREKFVLFVDDLSFDEQQTSYKDLKAVLEGNLEARPANVLLYATSNRRHLVQERFRDRGDPGDDEIHAMDTAQEKLSLSDRFGITLTFLAPDQERYLEIVRVLAQQRGLAVPDPELRERALRWTALHNARSGRTARQFVDFLAGELGMQRSGRGTSAAD